MPVTLLPVSKPLALKGVESEVKYPQGIRALSDPSLPVAKLSPVS